MHTIDRNEWHVTTDGMSFFVQRIQDNGQTETLCNRACNVKRFRRHQRALNAAYDLNRGEGGSFFSTVTLLKWGQAQGARIV